MDKQVNVVACDEEPVIKRPIDRQLVNIADERRTEIVPPTSHACC